MNNNRKYWVTGLFALCFLLLLPFSCKRSKTDTPDQSNNQTIGALARAIDINGIVNHLENFEQIANANSNHRASGSNGYNESVNYIKDVLSNTGYTLNEQGFACRYFEETEVPVMEMTAPTQKIYEWWNEFRTLTYSGSGDVTAEIVFITPVIPPGTVWDTTDDGCELSDFSNIDVSGKIAVIQRGTCTHQVKAANAEQNGAIAVLFFNEGTERRTGVYNSRVSREEKVNIPVLAISYDIGVELYNLVNSGQSVAVRVRVTTHDEWTSTSNFLAETQGGNSNRIIVIGAHLDSVTAGPGINDNGSGSAVILELAALIADQGYEPVNKIIFAWWGAEEQGLLGSFHYLQDLADNNPTKLQAIDLYLNFDMLASPNYIRGIMDSDASDIPSAFEQIPEGSTELEAAFVNYFNSRGLDVVYLGLGGGSDHYNFALRGIASSLLYTGASGLKTPEEHAMFGGTVGQPHDPCWHMPCDTVSNINQVILLQTAQAMAYVTEYFGDKEGSLFDRLNAKVKMPGVITGLRFPVDKPDLNHKDRLLRAVR
jgi:Zn-dependent M28 family amino/carboxypeptidase